MVFAASSQIAVSLLASLGGHAVAGVVIIHSTSNVPKGIHSKLLFVCHGVHRVVRFMRTRSCAIVDSKLIDSEVEQWATKKTLGRNARTLSPPWTPRLHIGDLLAPYIDLTGDFRAMARIKLPTREQAPAETHEILDAVQQRLGFLPNGLRLLSLSPSALHAFVGLQTTMSHALDAKTQEAVALAVSSANGCNYCVASHCFNTRANSQTAPDEITLNLEGKSGDPKRAAAAAFTKRIIETHGKVSDADLAAVRAAGYSDGQIVELTALAARYTLTNFLNNMADVEIDIPHVSGM
jgi:uncharacterized peroxidase-related enzyme